jgi:hypothetical protein
MIGKAYGNEKFSYELKDSILRLGNRLYIVEELTKDELVLLEYSKDDASTAWNFRQRFKKLPIDGDSEN